MVKTNMKNEKQTKIDEFDNKEIVEEKADEKTKTSQMKKLKSISKIVDEMIIELEPKPQSKSDGFPLIQSPEKKFNLGSRHKENKPGFFKSRENKMNFGSNHKESKPGFGKSPEKKFDIGSKSRENKMNFGSKSTGIKIIPVTSTKLQPAWKPKQE